MIRLWRPEIWILAVVFGIAALALAFGHIAEEGIGRRFGKVR
jgi:hypothetical protein